MEMDDTLVAGHKKSSWGDPVVSSLIPFFKFSCVTSKSGGKCSVEHGSAKSYTREIDEMMEWMDG